MSVVPARPTISAVIISCNEAEVIETCLRSVAAWVDEIVVVDMQSTDRTREIVQRFPARLIDHERLTYADPARNFAFAQASGDWILMLDPDEWVPRALADELRRIAGLDDVDVVEIPRQQIQFGRAVRSPGASDVAQPRFFRRGLVSWPPQVHGRPDISHLRRYRIPGGTRDLSLQHDTWRSVTEVLDKFVRYTPKDVENLQARGEHFSLRALINAPAGDFVRRMANGRAYEDGMAGLLTVLYFCIYRLTVFAHLWEVEGRTPAYDAQIERWGRRLTRAYRLGQGAGQLARRVGTIRHRFL